MGLINNPVLTNVGLNLSRNEVGYRKISISLNQIHLILCGLSNSASTFFKMAMQIESFFMKMILI